MPARVFSATCLGLDAQLIEVEADISQGLPGFSIVGLPDTAVQESRDRVKSAIKNSKVPFPQTKITVNLAPADLKKEGPAYDLPIALSILLAYGKINFDPTGKIFLGELSLDGKLRHINGILAMALAAKEKGYQTLFVPAVNAKEASLIPDLEIFPVKSLSQLINHFRNQEKITPYSPDKSFLKENVKTEDYDMAYIKGQEHAKRAMEIAAAGGHNILMVGPPGAGKTLLARTMPTILPQMSQSESLEVTKIYSVAGLIQHDKPLILNRPFRAPHHTSSHVSLVGGGSWPKPGEISLAHRGVLFLDEFTEFDRKVLESLRQPLEDGVIQISRAKESLIFPAKFILIAAMNPCPCGYYQSQVKECRCTPQEIIRYQRKISGPLLDRIDLHVEVPYVKYEKLVEKENQAKKSSEIQKEVEQAREIQKRRLADRNILTNSEMTNKDLKEFCQIDKESHNLLRQAVTRLHLSPRGFSRILKVARTIADLEKEENILTAHIAEALQYRMRQES